MNELDHFMAVLKEDKARLDERGRPPSRSSSRT